LPAAWLGRLFAPTLSLKIALLAWLCEITWLDIKLLTYPATCEAEAATGGFKEIWFGLI